MASYLASFLVLSALPLKGAAIIHSHSDIIWRLFPAVGLLFVTGLLDDWLCLKPWQKIAGQIAAAVWVHAIGIRILGVAGHALPPWCSLIMTVGWLLLCSNAFNLIDGIDGLAAGVGLTATLTTMIAGLVHHDEMLVMATAPLAGCLIGFLRYNFNPASIFLGDSGSLLIGFLLGSYGIIWSQKSATMLGVAAPLMALALPLLEVGLSIVRRFLSNRPIFDADRGHIHHRLLDRGFTPRRAALLLYGACGLGAALSLTQNLLHNQTAGLLTLLFGAGTAVGVQYLNYSEFIATRRFLWAGLRPMLTAHVRLEAFKRSLLAATNTKQCWEAVEAGARSLGYTHLDARFGGERFSTLAPPRMDAAFWQMRLNLPRGNYVNIMQNASGSDKPVLMIPFIEVVRNVLPHKLELMDAPVPSLLSLGEALEPVRGLQSAVPWNSRTSTVMSSDCAAPSVNAATLS